MKKVDFKQIIRYFNFRGAGVVKITAYRDWKAINLFFAILFFLFIIADGYISWKNLAVSKKAVHEETVTEIFINKSSLNKAIEKIRSRQAQFEERTNAPAVKDPSL